MTDTKWGKALTGPEMKALGLPDDTPVRHNKDVYLTRAFAFVDFCASYRLPKNHPAYTVHETNKRTGSRFVFHAGGDEPDDWDRGDVLVNDTHPRTIDGPAIDKYNWSDKYHRAKIIGYTRKGIVSETLVEDTQADTLTIKRMTEAERTRLAQRGAFEMSALQPHQQRVVAEKAELDLKREGLGNFKNTPLFARLPWQEQERLNTQAHIMTMYSAVLGERIAAFNGEHLR